MRRAFDTVLLLLVGLAIWQALHWAAPFALTSPAGTTARAAQMLSSANFWPHAAETARAFGWALLLAVTGGLALGFSLGLNRTSAEVAEPILVSVYSLPKVTLYPLILLVFGLGVLIWAAPWPRATRLALVAGAALLSVLISFSRTYLGAHWPSDGAGGLLLGTGWAALWVWWWERAGADAEMAD